MILFRLIIITFALICSSLFSSHAQSPMALSDLNFLETFAQDLYHRGEVRQAQKEFERIKRIDPQNAIANEYLAKFIPDTPAESAITKPSVIQQTLAIADDIKKLKTEIQTQEQNIEILKNTLRNSLAENETLYITLDKRTKEVLSLREQVYGLPDAPTSYKELMEGIVIERIPQQPFSTKMIPSIWDESQSDEHLSFADIQHTETLLHEARTQGVYDPMRIAELQILLDKQRAILADKNEALTLQVQALQSLKLDLDTINQMISSVDQDTSSSAQLLEQQYQKLIDQQHKQTLKEQDVFLSLLADYATLIKRIQELQNESAAAQKQILSFEEQYQKQNAQIEALNQKITQQTEQINAYQNTIKEKETIIEEQSQELDFTKQQLEDVNQSLSHIQQLLGTTDTEIASLQKELDLFKTFVDLEQKQQQSTINNLTQAMQITNEQNQNISELRDHIKSVYTQRPPLPTPSSAMTIDSQADAQKQLIRLNEILRQTEQDLYRAYLLLNEQDEAILDLEDQNQILEYQMTHFIPNDSSVEKEAASVMQQNNVLVQQNSALIQENSALVKQLKIESSILHDALLTKDQEIQNLHQNLFEKNTLIDDLQKTAETVAQLRQVVDENEKLIQKNTDLIAKNTDLAQQITTAQENTKHKEVALSLQELSFAEQQQESLAQITQAKQMLKDTRTQLTSLSLELQEKKTALYALEDHLQEQTSSLQDANKKIQKLEDQIASLAFKQKAMQEIAQQKEQEIALLEKELRLARKEANLENTKTQLALKEKIASLEKELSQAKKQLESRIKEAMNLQHETENLKKDLMMAQALMERYRQEKSCVPTQKGDCHSNFQRLNRTLKGGSQSTPMQRQTCWPNSIF